MITIPTKSANYDTENIKFFQNLYIFALEMNYFLVLGHHSNVMLCYVMLCYVMLCYVMLCYVMLCYVMLCYVMLCYVMLTSIAYASENLKTFADLSRCSDRRRSLVYVVT